MSEGHIYGEFLCAVETSVSTCLQKFFLTFNSAYTKNLLHMSIIPDDWKVLPYAKLVKKETLSLQLF